jgi:hypothetical protein
VVAHIFIAERDADDPLADQSPDAVLHLVLLPVVRKARRHPLDQPDRPIGVPQQQRPGIRGQRAPVERHHHPPPLEAFKLELFRRTLCRHRTPRTNLASV